MKMKLNMIVILIVFTALLNTHANGKPRTYNDVVRLKSYLFNSIHHDPHAMPQYESGEPLNITVGITLHQVVDVNEKLQYLQCLLWFRIFWFDENMRWNKSDFNGLHHIQVNHGDVWTPDIEVYNEMGLERVNNRHNFPVTIIHNGEVNWRYPHTLRTGCKINIVNFPHDLQICDLDIGSWTLDSRFVTVLQHKKNGGDISEIKTYGVGEWEVKDIPAKTVHHSYESGIGRNMPGYSVVIFSIHLKRRSNYYILHMVFPCIVIALLNSCSFLLPVSSGERISLSVTTLLGLVVFLLMIAELMPPTSGVVPLIDVYFGMCVVLVSLSVLLNVFIIHLHFRGSRGQRMPNWMRRVIFRLGKILLYGRLMSGVGFTAGDKQAKSDGESRRHRLFSKIGSVLSRKNTIVNDGENLCRQRHNSSTDEVKSVNDKNVMPASCLGGGEDGIDGKSFDELDRGRERRRSEVFSCEDTYLSVIKQERYDPVKLAAKSRRYSRAESVSGLDPIKELEQQTPGRKQPMVSESVSTEWKVMATVLDRLFFVFFMLAMSALMIIVLPARGE